MSVSSTAALTDTDTQGHFDAFYNAALELLNRFYPARTITILHVLQEIRTSQGLQSRPSCVDEIDYVLQGGWMT